MAERPARLPPLPALAAFESAARLGGFAAAAAELHVTPSAVSHRIRQLESTIGQPLFERTAGGVRPTAAGREALQQVRAAFAQLAQLGPARQARAEPLRLGLPPTFARHLLIPALPAFRRAWPEIELELDVVAPMQERPPRHDIDIRYGSGPFDERPVERLFDDELVALGAPAMVAEWGVHSPADLTRAPWLRSPLVTWRPWLDAAALQGCPEPARGQSFSDLGLLLEAAAHGLGITVGPRRLAASWLASGRLQPLFDIAVPAPSQYHLLAADTVRQGPAGAAFIGWLRQTFAGMAGAGWTHAADAARGARIRQAKPVQPRS